MHYLDNILALYGWVALVVIGSLLLLFCVQLYFYLFVYRKVAIFKNNRRANRIEEEPPISVIIPLMFEDHSFLEERLPLILAQNYHAFEIVIVYVGQDNDFYEDLAQLKFTFPQITTTKVKLDPRFPISRKMALNIGIKSAQYEHLIFSSNDASAQTDRWLSLMAKGFLKGDVVIGYCGMDANATYLSSMWRFVHSTVWLSRAVRGRAFRGTYHNMGFTKELYYAANGFNHLNMNIGEDDLFMQRIVKDDNASVILSPRATLRECSRGDFGQWLATQKYYNSTYRHYPHTVKRLLNIEPLSRLLLFATAVYGLVTLPDELKIAVGALLFVRYIVVVLVMRRIARRLGERARIGIYFIYDIASLLVGALLLLTSLRRDKRVWR